MPSNPSLCDPRTSHDALLASKAPRRGCDRAGTYRIRSRLHRRNRLRGVPVSRYSIIVEWFDTETEQDGIAVYEQFGAQFRAEQVARWYLKQQNKGARIPSCVRIEDSDETVLVTFDWVNGRVLKRRTPNARVSQS